MRKLLIILFIIPLASCFDSKPDPIFVKKIFENIRGEEFGYTVERNSVEVKKLNKMTYEATYIIDYLSEDKVYRRTANYIFSYGEWDVEEDLQIEDVEWVKVEEKIPGQGWVDVTQL